MKPVPRALSPVLLKAAKHFPAVILTGPRRAGKTVLLRSLFPGAEYHLLESPDIVARLRTDPQGFLSELKPPVILDEVQNVPEIFALVRAIIDRHPRKTGQWFLTGSQESPMMKGVAESMAGRAAILKLMPFSRKESPKVTLLRGGYPEVLARPAVAELWFSSYVQTYLERDVRSVTGVKDLATYRRFLALVAARHGQLLNKSDLAAPLGVSVPTITSWMSILEATMQIMVVPPYFENLGKRLVKTPKVYVTDSGMACHLLGIQTAAELARSPFRGAIFEGYVATEAVKAQMNAGRRQEIYFYRDQQGVEVDFLVPAGNGRMVLLEAKAGQTPNPRDGAAMAKIIPGLQRSHGVKRIDRAVVYGGGTGPVAATRALLPGTAAITVEDVPELIARGGPRVAGASSPHS